MLKGKSNAMKLFIIFTSNSLTETILTVSDRWGKFLCPFDRKEPNVRKSRDRKIKRFEFTVIYTSRSYTEYILWH